MILGFSTQLNGKPTYFVEKILLSMLPLEYNHPKYGTQILSDWTDIDYRNGFLSILNPTKTDKERLRFQDKLTYMVNETFKPKRHTIREDQKDRWKAGNKIDFFINCRQKDMFRFAPVLPVVSTQKVLMTYYHSDVIQISIDDRELFSYTERLEFAINDGFDSWEDFFNYFYPKIKAAEKQVYKPKLIHWTDLRY